MAVTISGTNGVNSPIVTSDLYRNSFRYTSVTSNFNAVSDTSYLVNTTSNAVIATLPFTPIAGDTIQFNDFNNTWSLNSLILNRNGNLIEGQSEDLICNSPARFIITFVGGSRGWKVSN
jgi:hypothetical protein